MATLQHLPYLGTAEDDVLFVDWLVAEGDAVAAGTPIATVETLKAAFDVDAEHAGVLLRQLCRPGERVGALAPLAVIGSAGEACDDAQLAALLRAAPPAPPPAVPAPTAAPAPTPEPATRPAGDDAPCAAPIAPAARRRAAELGVDVARVRGSGPDGLVRVADVEAHAASHRSAATARTAATDGRLDPEFVAQLARDEAAFAWLSSDFKLLLYRRHGAAIGDGCRFGEGAVLKAKRVVLGEGAFFGRDTVVDVGELTAGPLLHFGARCRVRCTRARFGENAFFADDVEIGGGGAMDPEAELDVGSHGFVGEHVHLNPCRTLRLGDEVVVSRGAVVMTHSFGPSWLQGYPSRFAGVTVGDGAQLGIGAVLFPGVDVGAGAVIVSGSSVVTSVPAGRLFGGVPAVDLKAAAQQLSPDEVAARAAALVDEFARQLRLRGMQVQSAAHDRITAVTVTHQDGAHVLEFAKRAAFAPDAGPLAERVLVAVAFDDAAFAAVPPTTTAVGLEPPRIRGAIGPLAAAFREFLRKRGVRLHPRGWAYTGGWL